jgi:diguanylate cyclase (GGDEF)-like protein
MTDYKELYRKQRELNKSLQKHIQTLHTSLTSLQNSKDSLTGLYKRDYLYPALEKYLLNLRRYNDKFSVIFIDVDDFKLVNDKHGHLSGDDVLRTLGTIIRTSIRTTDIAIRYGGDEFLIIVHAPAQFAVSVAQKILRRFSREEFYDASGDSFNVTLSVSVYQPTTKDTENDILHKADTGLYKAKLSGKQRVVVH